MKDQGQPQQRTSSKPQSWQDDLAEATPKRARYHTALRTDGYINTNLTDNYVEFWVAIRVDTQNDKWRVMHYQLFDMNGSDGKFKATPVVEKHVGFMEAIAYLSRNEYIANKQLMHKIVDMGVKYPAAEYPELRMHYYDVTHYKDAANVEGIAFDEQNDPYRRVQGMIFADATFKRSEVAKSILAVENPENVTVRPAMEAGVLSDIFSTSSVRSATLDGIIRMGECLNIMDAFAADIASFYMSVQKMLGQKPSLDDVDGMSVDERKTVAKQAQASVEGRYEDIVGYLFSVAAEKLEQAENLGVHTEPFSKFLAECEVYLHMLNASICLPKLEQSLYSINNADMGQVVKIQQSMQKAEAKFKQLGGTEEQVDQLKAWIANPSKDVIPGWLPGFLSRYYIARGKVMANVQARNARMRDLALMSAEIKPPVAAPDAAAPSLPAATEGADAASQNNKGASTRKTTGHKPQ